VVVGVAVSVFDFGFPGVFEFSLGFFEEFGSVQRYFCYLSGLVCVQVGFRDAFGFAVEAAYVFLVCCAKRVWKIEVGFVGSVRECFVFVCGGVEEF